MATATVRQALGVARADEGVSVEVSDVLAAGFPSADLIEFAADLLPSVPVPVVLPEGPSFSVSVSAGVVQLRAEDLAKVERRRVRRLPPSSAGSARYADERFVGDIVHGEAFYLAAGPMAPRSEAWFGPRSSSRGVVPVWSSRSRSNLVRGVASADWRPLLAKGVPVMVTLTYPGRWLDFAPTGRVAKVHLDRFRLRYRHAFGAPVGLWKMEFQERGAPHFHVLIPLPRGMSLAAFREWVAVTWNRVVFLDVDQVLGDFDGLDWIEVERSKHLHAGTAVDLREGLRCRDPKRIAVYFLKHSAKTMDNKEYQHVVPMAWRTPEAGPGRFWGFWGVDRPTATRYLTARDWIRLRRTVRRWATSNGRRIGQGGRLAGCWVAVNDGPAFLSGLARSLALAE